MVLDEKYGRRCEEFDGTPAKFKSWMFDLVAAVGSVDQSLAGDLRSFLKQRSNIEVHDNTFDIVNCQIDLYLKHI